jgi:hypothetical protein
MMPKRWSYIHIILYDLWKRFSYTYINIQRIMQKLSFRLIRIFLFLSTQSRSAWPCPDQLAGLHNGRDFSGALRGKRLPGSLCIPWVSGSQSCAASAHAQVSLSSLECDNNALLALFRNVAYLGG